MASSFDLGRFLDLAFGRKMLPDHTMQDEAEAKKLLALLPTGEQRIRVTRIVENNEHYQRVMFDSPGLAS